VKIYRVHHRDSVAESQGYEYFTSKKKAVKAARENAKDFEYAYAYSDQVQIIEFKNNKKGILYALGVCGSHPDNG